MNEQELRVGNWVFLKSQNLNPYEIHSGSEITTGCDSDDFEPISLSNPVLDKVKIEIGTKVGILFDGEYNLDIKNDVTRVSLVVYATQRTGNFKFIAELHGANGFVVLNEILYLHELQNLVFALTGKELKIDLSL